MSKRNFKSIYIHSKMTHEFAKQFEREAIETLEGLTGIRFKINLIKNEKISVKTKFPDKLIGTDVEIWNFQFNEDKSKVKKSELIGNGIICMPPEISTAIGDYMLGGDGESKSNDITLEDLDVNKEIISNIVGSLSTSLSSQNTLPNFKLKEINVIYYNIQDSKEDRNYSNKPIEIEKYNHYYMFSIEHPTNDKFNSFIYFLIDSNIVKILDVYENIDKVFEEIEEKEQSYEINEDEDKQFYEYFNKKVNEKNKKVIYKRGTEMNTNNDLIDDVEVKVSVLVGSQILTLEEMENLKENSTIELEQLANDPLTVYVNNIPYAEGEVVIVDGMYGVQITKLFTKEEVYHA